MGEKRTPLQHADFFIWVGIEALYVWDRRREEEKTVPLLQDGDQKIPYVPLFHSLWEKSDYYEAELRKALGRGKHRVLMAVPEDISFIESIALEDFFYAALGRRLKRRKGLTICSQSVALVRPKGQFIALTRTCRCYCVALVKDGVIASSQLLDAYKSERSALDWAIRDCCQDQPDAKPKIYYPEMEEDWTLMGFGRNVSFSRIATMDKPHKKSSASTGDGKIQRLS